MRRTITLFTAALLALAATGCSDSNAPFLGLIGRYELVSVDGETLPLVLIDDLSLKLTVTDGGLTLKANGRFTQDLTLEVVADGQAAPPEHLACAGTFQRSGNTFTMTGDETEECSGTTATAVLDGKTLTVSDEDGETLVFRR